MLTQNKDNLGFTIVELLIVIVVIAILAAISLVAYNGIQTRAYSANAVSVANSYIKLLEMYQADNGEYPSILDTPDNLACLGSSSDYPSIDGMAAGVCFDDGRTVSASLNTALSTYTNKLPSGALPLVSAYGAAGRGISYQYNGPHNVGLAYLLKQDGQCPIGVNVEIDNASGCIINLTTGG